MKKNQFGVILLAVALFTSLLPAVASAYSLIVAPARFSVLQVLFDVIDKRAAVLVSYQGEAGTENPVLHVWSGAAWNPLSLHELQELSFLQSTPERAILIGDDALLPYAVRDRLAWMPDVSNIRDISNASLINELGRMLRWSDYEWRWFAGRYKLDLEDRAGEKRKASWYDQPGPIAREGGLIPPVSSSTRDMKPAPVTTRVVEQPVEMEPEVIAIPEPPALAPVPVAENSFGPPVVEAEAPVETPVESSPPAADVISPETAPIKSEAKPYTLDNLIQELQAPVPAPAIEEPVSAK